MPATPMARCLLGLYSHGFLMRLHPWLENLDKISKEAGIDAEVAGELLLRARCSLALGGQAYGGEVVDEFGTGLKRVRLFFPSLDLFKFVHADFAEASSL